MKKKFKAFSFIFLLTLSTLLFADSNGRNDIFSVMSINRETELTGPSDDYYYSLTYVYSNISNKPTDSFWKDIRSKFVESDENVILQVQQETKSGGNTKVKASKVLGIFDKNETSITSNSNYKDKIIPDKRYQNSDSITIKVSLSEVTKERASTLKLLISEIDKVPLINSFTQGSLTLASTMIDTLTGITSGPSEKHRTATYSIHGINELAKLEYIAIIARSDEEKFKRLISKPEGIPKSLNSLNEIDSSMLPSFILMKVNAVRSLYSPDQILSINSPVRPLIGAEIESLVTSKNNLQRAKKCVELRSSLNYLGPLTSLDEGYAAMAALKKANYNPEGTAHHQNEGCLTFEEINFAREKYPNFKFGRCNSSSCRVANQFINSWVFGRNSNVSADEINWSVLLSGNLSESSGSEEAFLENFKLRLRYGDIKAHNSTSYTVIGAMLKSESGKTCVYDVEATLGLNKRNNSWLIDNISIVETDRVFDDGQQPSQSKYPNIPKCS